MSNTFKTNNSNSYYRNERPNNFLKNKKLFLFNNESFPDLVSPKNQENINKDKENNSLFTKVLHAKLEEEEREEEREKEEQEKKRWIVLKKGVPYQKQQQELEKEEVNVKEEVEPRKVFEQLNKNYHTWKKNYVELWGHDDYEKHYRFPNHDYRYYETSDSNSDLEDY